MGARRRDNGGLIELVSRLPWWAGVALAAVSYWALSALAAHPTTTTASGVPRVNLLAVIAGALQWVLPLVFVAGALASLVARARRSGLIQSAQDGGAAAVAGMDWREFELLIGEAFRRRGYRVNESGGGGADGGIDLVLTRDGKTTLVQCKHWKAYRVGVPVVRELYGVMTAERASAGIVVTSGRFTPEAEAFAEQVTVQLIDGGALRAMLSEVQADRSTPALAAAPPAAHNARSARTLHTDTPAAPDTPRCPICSAPMVQRTAAKGSRAGRSFWGCSTFPMCRGTRSA